MSETTAHDAIAQALETLEEAKSEPTGGKWLERLTAQIAPLIKEWDISYCWTWSEWPDRERLLPDTTNQDNGIDACQGRRQNIPVGRSKSVPPERSLASVNVRASCSGEVSQRQAGNRLGG